MESLKVSVSEILRDILYEKTKRNPSYSLRAMARDLEVSPGYLSLVFAGKRKLPFERAVAFCQVLGLDDKQTELLLRSTAVESMKDGAARGYLEKNLEISAESDDFVVLEIDRFKFLSQWFHIAILDLTEVEGFKSDESWIADQLEISVHEVHNAVSRLVRMGFLEVRGKRWRKTQAKLAIPTQHSDKAVREFHSQMIERAKHALQTHSPHEFPLRDINGTTFAINPERMADAKKRIQKFRRELFHFLTQGPCTELYQLNFQLFRLTKDPLTKRRKTK